MATREFGAVVERDRVTAFLVQFLQTLFDSLMHVVGVFGCDLDDDRVPRLAVHQRRQATGARRAEHGVAFKVAQAQPLLDDFRTISDAGAFAGVSLFSAAGALAALPQKRAPMLAIGVLLDPV